MRPVCALVLVLALTACGGRSTSGKHLFDSRCAACHTLTGHDTQIDGGDLALGSLTVADVVSFGRVMPVRPALTPAELRAVATYVVDRREALAR